MKANTPFLGDRSGRQGLTLVHYATAPLWLRCLRVLLEHLTRWRDLAFPSARDTFIRVSTTLSVVLVLWVIFYLFQLNYSNVYTVHINGRDQIVKVFDPSGKEVHLTPQEVWKIRNKNPIYVP
ncbi:MAG: hypothetical protein AAB391_03720 [Patescibacteria group bacterium]